MGLGRGEVGWGRSTAAMALDKVAVRKKRDTGRMKGRPTWVAFCGRRSGRGGIIWWLTGVAVTAACVGRRTSEATLESDGGFSGPGLQRIGKGGGTGEHGWGKPDILDLAWKGARLEAEAVVRFSVVQWL